MKSEFETFAVINDAIGRTNAEIAQCERLLKAVHQSDSQEVENTLVNLRSVHTYLDQAATFYVQAYPDFVLNE